MARGFLTTNKPEKDIYKTLDELTRGLKPDEINRLLKEASDYLTKQLWLTDNSLVERIIGIDIHADVHYWEKIYTTIFVSIINTIYVWE